MKSRLVKIIAVGILICAVLCMPVDKDMLASVDKSSEAATVVIDPGHGGVDGGAKSSSGAIERDINLKISLLLKELLEDAGFTVVMTREDESGHYEDVDENASIRGHKVADTKARKKIIDEAGAQLAISVHLNSFQEDPGVKGAQVFYPSSDTGEFSEDSKNAAKIIQQSLNETINVDKARSELGRDGVFILKEPVCPIVIVECGFLSNPQEADLLEKGKYQAKIAGALKAGICAYLGDKGLNR